MTENLNKDIIVYTIINNKVDIIGQFENISISIRDDFSQIDIPILNDLSQVDGPTLKGEIQIAFVLENGYLNINNKPIKDGFVSRAPRLNISCNSNKINLDKYMPNKSEAIGRYELVRCMFDTPCNNNIEGVAEGIRFIPERLKEFIDRHNKVEVRELIN